MTEIQAFASSWLSKACILRRFAEEFNECLLKAGEERTRRPSDSLEGTQQKPIRKGKEKEGEEEEQESKPLEEDAEVVEGRKKERQVAEHTGECGQLAGTRPRLYQEDDGKDAQQSPLPFYGLNLFLCPLMHSALLPNIVMPCTSFPL